MKTPAQITAVIAKRIKDAALDPKSGYPATALSADEDRIRFAAFVEGVITTVLNEELPSAR